MLYFNLLFFIPAKPVFLKIRMMNIEKRLGELETENADKKNCIVALDSTNKQTETTIKDKDFTVNILNDDIDALKSKFRYTINAILLYTGFFN